MKRVCFAGTDSVFETISRREMTRDEKCGSFYRSHELERMQKTAYSEAVRIFEDEQKKKRRRDFMSSSLSSNSSSSSTTMNNSAGSSRRSPNPKDKKKLKIFRRFPFRVQRRGDDNNNNDDDNAEQERQQSQDRGETRSEEICSFFAAPQREPRGLERIIEAQRAEVLRLPYHDVSEQAKSAVLMKQFECTISNPVAIIQAYGPLSSMSLLEAQERARHDQEEARRLLKQ